MRCTMVITAPNAFVAQVTDRMPVVLEKHQLDQWMHGTPDEAAELRQPVVTRHRHEASPR